MVQKLFQNESCADAQDVTWLPAGRPFLNVPATSKYNVKKTGVIQEP